MRDWSKTPIRELHRSPHAIPEASLWVMGQIEAEFPSDAPLRGNVCQGSLIGDVGACYFVGPDVAYERFRLDDTIDRVYVAAKETFTYRRGLVKRGLNDHPTRAYVLHPDDTLEKISVVRPWNMPPLFPRAGKLERHSRSLNQNPKLWRIVTSLSTPPIDGATLDERWEDVQRALRHLTPIEQVVIRNEFGSASERKTQAELGRELGVTQARVAQIKREAIAKLQVILRRVA